MHHYRFIRIEPDYLIYRPWSQELGFYGPELWIRQGIQGLY